MKQQPKIIYSLDTYPLINNRWHMGNRLKETIYMTSLSVLQSHMWYPEIELFVDETAYKFLYMLPCKVTLISHDSDPDLWMKVKMAAIECQNTPFVHLDTDVFLSNNIDFDFSQIIIERQEFSYKGHYKPQLKFFNKYMKHLSFWNNDLGTSYSCGVVGFQDLELRDKYIESYNQVEELFKLYKQNYRAFKQNGYEPCIVIEQYTLACLLDYLQVKPNLLLKGKDMYEQAKNAKNIGFSHLFGVKKYEENVSNLIEERLEKIFPYWYHQVKNEVDKYSYDNSMALCF
ncbi:DUF6734 family protein [Tenacibaculum xiamenense]|uniref:DUF6734 family protein n=1 Tax=Tenacibaculum xiamenense TaxID=1261553 RepID=UPI00389445D5